MLTGKRGAAFALAGFLALGAYGLWASLSSSSQPYGAANSAQGAHQKNPTADQVAMLVRFGNFLDDHGGAVTAGSTAFIAAFTVALVVVTNRQARLTRASIELANKEFVATHRPRLRLRSVRPRLNPGLRLGVHYIVVNVGETPAHIKHIETTLWLRLPSGEEVLPALDAPELRTLIGGQRTLYITLATDLRYEREMGIHEGGGGELEFRGFIEYADDNGVDRLTGFWRIYSPKTGRFHPKDDPDYEYQD